MRETNEQRARRAIERLMAQADGWNCASTLGGYKISFSCGPAMYRKGDNITDVLGAADQRMHLQKAARST